MAKAPTGPHRVRRPFDADGRRMSPGEIIDVTDWRNAYQLVDRGYLLAVYTTRPNETTTPVEKIDPPVEIACPRCGASGDDPCVTKSGKPTGRHSVRD